MMNKIIKNFLAIILGIIMALAGLEICLRGLGWWQNNRNLFTKITLKSEDEIRILALGESMTAAGLRPFYPEQLQGILSRSLTNKKIIVFNQAVPGFSSKTVLLNLEKNLDKYQPDIVTIMIGCNDFGMVQYEEFAGIKNSDFWSNWKIYKLYKFLLKNLQEKFIKMASAAARDEDLVQLGKYAKERNQIIEAKEYFRKALQINPNNAEAYIGLADIAFDEPIEKRIGYYQQAIKIDPANPHAYNVLANLYYLQGREKERLEILNLGLTANPHAYDLLISLATIYLEQNNIAEAIRMINRAFSGQADLIPKPVDIQLLGQLYQSQGKTQEAGEVLGWLTQSSQGLAQNYVRIAEILKKRGIILVAVQYPMRDIAPLKTILKDNDAILVDNEQGFKDRVADEGPQKYFVDRFAGDFGHLTAEGHRLVAENIAEAILQQAF